MRSRINIILTAVVLAILSFCYARYDYTNNHSATLTNPFGSHESTTVTDPFMDKSLFGDWMKKEVLFSMVVPGALIAVGLGIAIGRKWKRRRFAAHNYHGLASFANHCPSALRLRRDGPGTGSWRAPRGRTRESLQGKRGTRSRCARLPDYSSQAMMRDAGEGEEPIMQT